MNIFQFREKLEKYYNQNFLGHIWEPIEDHFKKCPEHVLSEIYQQLIENISRNYKAIPDLAQMITFERKIILRERKNNYNSNPRKFIDEANKHFNSRDFEIVNSFLLLLSEGIKKKLR